MIAHVSYIYTFRKINERGEYMNEISVSVAAVTFVVHKAVSFLQLLRGQPQDVYFVSFPALFAYV